MALLRRSNFSAIKLRSISRRSSTQLVWRVNAHRRTLIRYSDAYRNLRCVAKSNK